MQQHAWRRWVSTQQRVAVFMAGLPGSGKTRIIQGLYGATTGTTILDLDREMRAHPLYDPTRPAKVYEARGAYDWANDRVERRFQAAVRDDAVSRIVLDGTGTKINRRLRRIATARAHGLRTIMLYVRVSLATALRRNAKRCRVVPARKLEEYQILIDRALCVEEGQVDCYEIIDNDQDIPDRDKHIRDIRSSKPHLKCVHECPAAEIVPRDVSVVVEVSS
ncbi:hypothetical protein CTAYLR_007692 [Chrysophaeum taylorii]|uniref:Uncharacterized protein n=1 Tax=Chrysophaeum taylorii TaxID=2483200 RepID=A0AAD7U749_9STRA|nr:hypothetical protein CTAYLR_007692 [Chrysophaeum taylorii]